HFDRWRLVRFGLASAVSAVAYLIVIGVPTAVIPNPWFERMTDVTASNVVFWIVPALLTGALLGSYVVPLAATTCEVGGRTVFAALPRFLPVGCRLCNKVVVLFIGAAGRAHVFRTDPACPRPPVRGNARVRALAPRRPASVSIPLTRAGTLAGMPPAARRY